MIPRRIRLHNFLSYRECTVNLAGLHLAVLSGRNGEGKSALLDGMTWALWGEARGRLEDDLIHQAETEMLVEFEFEVNGDLFAAVRKRTRGRSGALDLLQMAPDGGRISLTGGTMRETQAEIVRRVRMDFDTFVNSAFIAQGRANEFTRKPAAERKEVFRKVLDLGRYEQLSAAANDRKKESGARLTAIGRENEDLRTEVARLPEVEAQLADVVKRRDGLEPVIAAAEAAVTELRQAAADYERLQREAGQWEQRAGEGQTAVTAAEAASASLEQALAKANELLAEKEAIEGRYGELVRARAAEHEAAERQAAAAEAERAAQAAARTIAEERARLETSLAAFRRDHEAATTAAAALPELRAAEGGLVALREELAALDERIEAARAEEGEFRAREAAARADAEQCRKQAQEMKDKETQLEGVATCPVCRQPLSPGDLEHVRAEYAEQRRTLGERFRDALAAAEVALTGADGCKSVIATLQQEWQVRESALRARERDVHTRLTAAEEASARLPGIAAALAEAEGVLATGAFAAGAHEEHVAAQERLKSAGYDAAEHQRLRATVRELADAEDAYRELARAGEKAAALESALGRERAALQERQVAVCDAREALQAARGALEAATDVTPRLESAEAELAALRNELQECVLAQGRLGQVRDDLWKAKARLETQADEMQALKDEEAVFGELAAAFGKNGVQAMLIDQALPRLELIANEMLDRMTGGRIQVTLHTQRQNQKGAIVETLDIRISDELGGRDYDMYSGGEAFRVDFALRIALAKLLAERAGAALPTLIIDEGFGTQDLEGIDGLVEAINAIADEFRLILVVTHIDELKERFDRRIEVTKDLARGSVAAVI